MPLHTPLFTLHFLLQALPDASSIAEAERKAAEHIPDAKQALEAWSKLSADEVLDKVIRSLLTFGKNLALAILIFYVGKFIINRLYLFVFRILERRKVDTSLSTFLLSLIKLVLYFILIITVVGVLGIETSSFLALFASAGVAIGLALSGTLQNFAGGVLILLLKPYRVGDYIEAQGYAGIVMEIQIFSTIINTYDNKSIIIPNGPLSTSSINNWSREDYRRIDWNVSISYGDDIARARQGLLDIIGSDPRVVKGTIEADREERHHDEATEQCPSPDKVVDGQCEAPGKRPSLWQRIVHHHRLYREAVAAAKQRMDNPPRIVKPAENRPPLVVLSNLGDSSVDLIARAWVNTEYYWSVFYDINERIYTELPDRAGVSFPFPQMDIHLPMDKAPSDQADDRGHNVASTITGPGFPPGSGDV